MNVNILDHINISDQLEIEEIDLPKKWYRVVERFERYNGVTAFVSVTTKQNSADFYLSIFYDVVDDFGNLVELPLMAEHQLENIQQAVQEDKPVKPKQKRVSKAK